MDSSRTTRAVWIAVATMVALIATPHVIAATPTPLVLVTFVVACLVPPTLIAHAGIRARTHGWRASARTSGEAAWVSLPAVAVVAGTVTGWVLSLGMIADAVTLSTAAIVFVGSLPVVVAVWVVTCAVFAALSPKITERNPWAATLVVAVVVVAGSIGGYQAIMSSQSEGAHYTACAGLNDGAVVECFCEREAADVRWLDHVPEASDIFGGRAIGCP